MGAGAALDTRPESAAGVLAAARDRRRAADAAEADLCRLAVQWAAIHPADSIHEPATFVLRGCGQTDLTLAGLRAWDMPSAASHTWPGPSPTLDEMPRCPPETPGCPVGEWDRRRARRW